MRSPLALQLLGPKPGQLLSFFARFSRIPSGFFGALYEAIYPRPYLGFAGLFHKISLSSTIAPLAGEEAFTVLLIAD